MRAPRLPGSDGAQAGPVSRAEVFARRLRMVDAEGRAWDLTVDTSGKLVVQ